MVTRELKRPMRRLDDLVVIRISDSSNVGELREKTLECAHRFVGLPGADALQKLGATPLLEPERVEGRYVRAEQFRATHFRIPGTQTQVLQVLGSATKANVGEADNAFVELLADVLDVDVLRVGVGGGLWTAVAVVGLSLADVAGAQSSVCPVASRGWGHRHVQLFGGVPVHVGGHVRSERLPASGTSDHDRQDAQVPG